MQIQGLPGSNSLKRSSSGFVIYYRLFPASQSASATDSDILK